MPRYFELVTKFLFAARDFNRPLQYGARDPKGGKRPVFGIAEGH